MMKIQWGLDHETSDPEGSPETGTVISAEDAEQKRATDCSGFYLCHRVQSACCLVAMYCVWWVEHVFCTVVMQLLACFGGLFSQLLFGNDSPSWNREFAFPSVDGCAGLSLLCWTQSVLLLCRHIIKIIATGVEITISQNQGCSLLKSQYCPSNDCVQRANVSVSPSCYMHHHHCLMNYYLSTVCCRTVRNTSLYKFEFNCFSYWWPYFLSKWWGSGKGLVGRFQTLLEKKKQP